MRLADRRFFNDIGHPIPIEAYLDTDPEVIISYCRNKILESINEMERSSSTFNEMSEDSISDVLATIINSAGIVTAGREENENGHCDFRITAPLCLDASVFTYIGEAKRWRSTSWSIEGFDQLVDRYMRLQHKNGFLLVYVQTSVFDGFSSSKDVFVSDRDLEFVELEIYKDRINFFHGKTKEFRIDCYGAHFPKKSLRQ